MSAIQSGAPHRLLEIAAETLPHLPFLLNPAFLAAVLPAALVPLFIRSAGGGGETEGADENEPTVDSNKTDSTGA